MKEWTTSTANTLAVLVVPEGLSDDEGELITLDLDETEGPRLSDHLTQQQKTEALKLISHAFQPEKCASDIPEDGRPIIRWHERIRSSILY